MWRQENDQPYPLSCRIGDVWATVNEERAGGTTCYTVKWTDGAKQFSARALSPAAAKVNAEIQAQMLYLKSSQRRTL